MNAAYLRTLFVLLAIALPVLAQAPLPAKKVVLLDDGSLIEGTVDSIDGVVRITPAAGSTKIVAARQIAFVGESRVAAYEFAAGKVDAKSADGARQLAEWCEKVGMNDKALIHAKAAAAATPGDKYVLALVARLEKAAASKTTTATSTPKPAEAVTLAMVELASGAGASFATKVQPILTNQCASCHAAKDYSGTFRLNRIAEGYANPEALSSNMKSVAVHLSRENPAASPFLRYGLVAHGGQKRAAFANRELTAYQNLEAWVVGSLPRRVVQTGFVAATPPSPQPVRDKVEPDATTLPGDVVGAIGRPVAAKPVPPTAPSPATTAPTSAVKPNAADPFDPQSFNRLPKKTEK